MSKLQALLKISGGKKFFNIIDPRPTGVAIVAVCGCFGSAFTAFKNRSFAHYLMVISFLIMRGVCSSSGFTLYTTPSASAIRLLACRKDL
jgi:hypothetical protein